MTQVEKKPLDPKLFGPNPVRDERFDSKDRWHELPNFPHDHPNSRLEFLTRQMNEEINATEMAARNLVDFPDADWGLRMAIARQAADEARHAMAFRRLLEQRGGYLGHGDGVAHAHLIVVPQHGPHHLTSDRLARIEGGRIVFDLAHVPRADRATLDEQARALWAAMES